MAMTGESLLYRQGAMSSSVFYRDPTAAMRWLAEAFGFEVAFTVSDESGAFDHIEMSCGEGVITVAGLWGDFCRSPQDVAGGNTQSLKFVLAEDIDAHFGRAVAAGARVIQDPGDQAYLQRTYRVADLEGHVWTFATNL